jgi:predicted aspartyl protease
MLEALTEIGFLEEYNKGVFKCVRDPKLQRRAWSLGALAEQALKHGLEETFLNLLQQQRELFMCSEIDDYERYWDKVRESFAQSKFYDDSYHGAITTSALSAASTTPTVTVSRASTARVELCDVSNDGLSALLGGLPASYSCDRDLGTHKAPRIDNSDPYKVALSVNGRILQNIIVDTGCEMVVVGQAAARQARIRPSMMLSGAVALWCADERVTKTFNCTIDPIPFVFNPGTENETVMAQIVVTNSAADAMLLGMSVIGKIGLVPNSYKGTLKYYVNWETQGSRSAHLACVFDVELGTPERKSVRNTVSEEVYSGSALLMPIVDMPRNKFDCWANRLHYQDYHRQFVRELALSCSQLVLSALKGIEATPALISLDGYRDLRPLNQDLIAIAETAMNQGLIVVELCGGILSATEALIWTGIKIQKLYVCEIALKPELLLLPIYRY